MNYNLVTQPWVSMILRNSTTQRMTLLAALEEGHRAQLAYVNPLDRIAVFRFILAALYWCWQETGVPIEEKGAPKAWITHLKDKAGLFELMGDGNRFMQCSGLSRLRPISELFHEIPTGNNFWHFHHVRDYTAGVCTHCVVSGMLRLPLFSVSGLPDLKSGINGSPPVYAIKWGKSLWETIYLNWLPREPLGEPIWAAPYQYSPDDDVPLLSGMTVPARRLFLDDAVESDRSCVVCGSRPGYLHYSCKFESAGILENKQWQDPFELRLTDAAIKASNIIGSGKLRYDVKTRDLITAYMASRDAQAGVKVLLVGFATDKAKFVDIWERTISIPDPGQSQDSIEVLHKWGEAISKTAIYKYHLKSKVKKDRLERLKTSLQNDLLPDAEARFATLLPDVLAGRVGWEKASGEYSRCCQIAARVLVSGIGSQQLRDRMYIRLSVPKPIVDPKSANEGGENV